MENSFKIKRIFGGLKKKLFFNNNQIEEKHAVYFFLKIQLNFSIFYYIILIDRCS